MKGVVGDPHAAFQGVAVGKSVLQQAQEVAADGGTVYAYLGDYVDRGLDPLMVLMEVMAAKIVYRKNYSLLRGNHEASRHSNTVQGH